MNVVKELSNSSPGHDNIPISVIKKVLPHILQPLAHIIRLSFTFSLSFPTQTNGCKDQSSLRIWNCVQLISGRAAFSNTFEKLIYRRLNAFQEDNSIMNDSQYGFLSETFTEIALKVCLELTQTYRKHLLLSTTIFFWHNYSITVLKAQLSCGLHLILHPEKVCIIQ